MTSSRSTTSNSSRRVSLGLCAAASIAALLLSAGCSSVRPVEVQTAPIKVDLPQVRPLPNPAPIKTVPFTWEVLPPDKAGTVYYGVTVKDYESLAKTMADILRWVEEARWRLDYYRSALAPKKEPVK